MANYVSLLLSHVRLARQTRKIENRLLDTRDSFDDIRQHALETHSNLTDHHGERYLPDPDLPTPEDIELILAVDHLRSARQKIERPWMKASLAWRAGDEPRQQLRGIGYPWRARSNKNIRQHALETHRSKYIASASEVVACGLSKLLLRPQCLQTLPASFRQNRQF